MTENWSKNQEAQDLARAAELGAPGCADAVHARLMEDMQHMTAEEYARLLSDIADCNKYDRSGNSHLPVLEVHDTTGRGVANEITAHYDNSPPASNTRAQSQRAGQNMGAPVSDTQFQIQPHPYPQGQHQHGKKK